MAKRKPPVRKKAPPKKPKQTSGIKTARIGFQQNIEPDFVSAGKHLADAIKSLSKALEAVTPDKPQTFTSSWWTTS